MGKNLKNNRGITLIALIITVIVMIILAFTTINLFIGKNGIFKKSNEGAEIYKNSANDEAESLNELDNKIGDLMNKIDGKPKLIINLVEFTENKRIQGDCTIEVYTDKACQNLIRTIAITKQDYTQERCYETYDVLEEGTYYLMVKNVPTGYVRLNYINTKTITKGQNNIWEIAFIIEDSPNAQEGLYDREYAMSYTFTYPSEVEAGLEFPVKVYKIGEYDEDYDKITYDAKLDNLGLKELSILDVNRTWMQKDSEFAKKIEEVVGEITEHQNGIIAGLDAAGAYFIDLEDVDSLEYHYSCRPLLYTHYPYYQITGNKDAIFDLAMYKESIYDKERLKGKVKINSNVSNYNREKGAVTVVYEVQATTPDGEVQYSDIVKTTYNKEVAGYMMIDNILAGANVTATVKYVSPSYQIYAEDTQSGICISDKEVSQGENQCEFYFDFVYNAVKSTGWGILEMQIEHDEQRAN